MLRTVAAMSLLALSSMAIAQTTPAPSAAASNTTLTAPLPADQAAMKAHVMFLASDAMRGREAGSPEYDIAAQYVAAQFYAAGLKPAGDEGGYLQKVPLVSYKSADKGTFVLTGRDGSPQPLVFGEDVLPSPNPAATETSVNAGLVFVGYGIDAPHYKQDDYKGIDARGKIVVYAAGAPARFGGEERAFFGSPATKARTAAAHGAVGLIQLADAKAGTDAFKRMADYFDRPRITWAKADGTGNSETPRTPLLGTLGPAGAAKLLGKNWDPVRKQMEGGKPVFASMAEPGTLSVATKTLFTPAASSNVVGIVPGSDPAVGGQVVILSAHLDHIGVGRPVNGDSINNGALDNAIGIASLIEEAKRFTTSGNAPKRTVMFLAVTAEEKGLVGSDYFANNPTVPVKDIVADVNLDMPMLTYVFEDMTVFGAERSTLGPVVAKAVAALGVTLSPDPMPEEGIFVRSDHFRFVQKGIPSVFLWPGQKGPGKAAVAAFMGNCYHRPCDDLSQPILWDQGVRFVDANYRIAREIADGATRPVWNKGDYFGTLFKGPMAK